MAKRTEFVTDWKVVATEAQRDAAVWQERAWVAITALVIRAKVDLGSRPTKREINALVSLQIRAAEAFRKGSAG